MSERRRATRAWGGVVAALALVGACTAGEPSMGVSSAPASTTPASTPASPAPSPVPTASPGPAGEALGSGPVEATARTVVDGLDAPWGLAVLDDGRLLVSLRDEARLVLVDPSARTTTPVTGPGADQIRSETRPDGEGGLLGVAVDESGQVFVYRTGSDDNAVLRARLDGDRLGEVTTVLDGIPRASNHDGGRLAFGPDGYLYVTTGDAGDTSRAQDPGSLGGKILRVTADGEPAPGNPDSGSPVWSLGHRNVQGLGWDPDGRMFASEFGQSTLDEVNLIEPGANYGWPDVEGPGGGDAGYVDPIAWWPTSQASPSGLAVTGDAVYVAGLRGERLWRVPFEGEGFGRPQDLVRDHGRLRAVVADADGSLWVLTNNTDGRGTPAEGDDRLLRVVLRPS